MSPRPIDRNDHKYWDGKTYFSVEYAKRSEHFDMKRIHYHENYEVYYLLSGERNYFIKDKFFRISKGDLVFIDEYELHKTMAAPIPEHERILLYFQKEFMGQEQKLLHGDFSPFQQGPPVLSLNIHEQKFVEDLLYKTLAEHRDGGREHETYIRALVTELIIFSMRCNEKRLNRSVESKNPRHRKVSEIVQYINRNYASRLTLTSLSEHFYISSYYLSRMFKQTTDFSFVEYLTVVRIKESQRLLRETDYKVSRIAEEVGFEDFAHFGRVFKKLTNCSPLQYRKMNRREP